jgi:hypothetical protein
MTDLRDLHDLLDLATDRLDAPGLATGALATAGRRRRNRRAGVVASAAAVLVVAGVAVAGLVGSDSSDEPMPAPSPPTRTVEPDLPTFDPTKVDDLPPAPADLIPVLPDVLDVPTSTPTLAEDPVGAAVLTFARSDALKVLGVDGAWRHVPLPVEGGSVALSPDGTRLLVQTAAGVDVWDVTTGVVSAVPLPPEPTNDIGWTWTDDGALVVFDLGRAWVVDPVTGEAGRRTDRDSLWDVGVEVGWSDADGSLAVSVDGHRLLVRDDNQATYANGALSVQAVLDDGTVLLRVLVDPGPAASVRFVAWEPDSGELWWVMHVPDVLPGWSLAADVLG